MPVRWGISGTLDNPADNKLTVSVLEGERTTISLEISVPGLRAAEGDRDRLVRQALQAALTELQAWLDSPSMSAPPCPDQT